MEIETHYLPLHIRNYIIPQAEMGEKYENIIKKFIKSTKGQFPKELLANNCQGSNPW